MPKLTGQTAYIAKVIGRERSQRHDRLTPARLAPAITVVDLDSDGIPDYMVDYDKVIHTSWCGTGGCDLELWRGTKSGRPVRVWNEMVREHSISSRAGKTIFDFDFHGSNCGTFGAEACPASFAWDATAGRMLEQPTPDGNTTVRLIEPIRTTKAQVPAPILALIQKAREQCVAAGQSFVTSDNLPVSVPDFDGDGVRDWVITLPDCSNANEFTLVQTLFATAGDDSAPVMAATAADVEQSFFELSFGTKPATVSRANITDACERYSVEPDVRVCSRTPMVWDSTGKTLRTLEQK